MTFSPDDFDTSGLELVPMEGEGVSNPLDEYTPEQQSADAVLYSVVEKPVTGVMAEVNTHETREDYSNDPVIKEYKRQISIHQQLIEGLVAQRNINLGLRTSGQISGVELDRLDAEVDKSLDYSHSEIRRLTEGINNNIDFIKNEPAVIENTPQEVTRSAESSPFERHSPEALLEMEIQSAGSMRDLSRALAKFGQDIVAKDGYVYKLDFILPLVGSITGSQDANIQRITNTYGLRDKVVNLTKKAEAGF